MGAVSAALVQPSNSQRPRSWPQKIEPQPIVFRDVARLAYPHKTIAALGHVTGRSRSTIKYWLSGEHEAPAWVLAMVMAEIMRRLSTGR